MNPQEKKLVTCTSVHCSVHFGDIFQALNLSQVSQSILLKNPTLVPKQNDLQLETTQVTLADVVQLRFFTEYQWLLDFSLYALFVYFITEVSKSMPVPTCRSNFGQSQFFCTWVKKQILIKTV